MEVLGEREVVGVGGIGLDAGEDGVGRDEAGNVVNVAVGVVAGAAAGEPEGLVDAEVVAEGAFELGAGLVRRAEAGVALLDFGEEALLGGEQDACAVGVDGAAFEDDAAAVEFRAGFLGEVVELGDAVRNWSSRRKLEYLAQALNFQLVTARLVAEPLTEASDTRLFLTKTGPESRSQTRSVGQ